MRVVHFISETLKGINFPFFATQSKKIIAIEEKAYCNKHFISDFYCNDEFLFI